jgi:hypothetical protein
MKPKLTASNFNTTIARRQSVLPTFFGTVSKYSVFVLLAASLAAGTQSYGQEKTGANDNKDGDNVGGGTSAVWAVPAEQKVRPTDAVESSNLVWSKDKKKITVAGAGNEHVPFQVVVSVPVPPGRRPKAPEGFFVTASNLTSKQGKTIPSSQINMFVEHYIMVYGKSGPVGETGMWPDALAPLKEPFTMAAQYAVVRNRPIWVDVSVPASTPAGTYTGTITVSQNGNSLETLNVDLQVYGFSLPARTHMISYMNVSKGSLASFYHKDAKSAEIDKLTQTYYDFLYDHRMEPWFNDQLEPKIEVNGDKVEVKFDDDRYQYYMNKLNSNRVLLETFPSDLRKQIKDERFSNAFDQKVKSYLSQVEAYFKKHGWKEHLVFNSPIDEPNTKEDYEITRKWATLVHEAAPGVPFLATESPVTDDPAWGTLTSHVNNFSIHGNALNDQQVKQAIQQEQAKGGEMTWYISCDQVYPQPNYFIDAPALDPVMVPWITARYKMAGILYWAANFWSETPNPWLDPITFISGFLCSGGYLLNGEGSLLYPGNFVKAYTKQPDVDGPVSSIRFELLREGIEDYEYLWMLKDLGDSKFADATVQSMAIDVSSFSRNPQDLYAARKAMAKRLEELSRKK